MRIEKIADQFAALAASQSKSLPQIDPPISRPIELISTSEQYDQRVSTVKVESPSHFLRDSYRTLSQAPKRSERKGGALASSCQTIVWEGNPPSLRICFP